jgi:hypothetical protein
MLLVIMTFTIVANPKHIKERYVFIAFLYGAGLR